MNFKIKNAVLTAVVASALIPVTAEAHVQLRSSYPGAGSVVGRRLDVVRVVLTGPIRSGQITVVGAKNKVVSIGRGGRDPRSVNRLIVPIRGRLSPGTYRASWSIVSADGHRQSGAFRFRLR